MLSSSHMIVMMAHMVGDHFPISQMKKKGFQDPSLPLQSDKPHRALGPGLPDTKGQAALSEELPRGEVTQARR